MATCFTITTSRYRHDRHDYLDLRYRHDRHDYLDLDAYLSGPTNIKPAIHALTTMAVDEEHCFFGPPIQTPRMNVCILSIWQLASPPPLWSTNGQASSRRPDCLGAIQTQPRASFDGKGHDSPPPSQCPPRWPGLRLPLGSLMATQSDVCMLAFNFGPRYRLGTLWWRQGKYTFNAGIPYRTVTRDHRLLHLLRRDNKEPTTFIARISSDLTARWMAIYQY
ncbi:hypothetical protein RJ55_04455 [Drechmeria coniospora]|nr:hypothetical protein RJ55_04455 [Drechmeria coniospora]